MLVEIEKIPALMVRLKEDYEAGKAWKNAGWYRLPADRAAGFPPAK